MVLFNIYLDNIILEYLLINFKISSIIKAQYKILLSLHGIHILEPLSVLFPMGLTLLLIDVKNKAVKFRLIELLF